MYLLSLYFDSKTHHELKKYMDHIASITDNHMMDNVPPHITLLSFECQDVDTIIPLLDVLFQDAKQSHIQFVSFGVFKPYVLFIQPVLNQYLHQFIMQTYDCLKQVNHMKLSPYYQPYQWLPHVTVGKRLNQEEMLQAFAYLHHHFSFFSGVVTAIGLSKTNPYQDIKIWKL